MSERSPELRDAVVPDAMPEEPLAGRRRRLRLAMFPTMLTLGNLVCGFLAIAYMTDAHAAFSGAAEAAATKKVVLAGWVILLGLVFDALDGRVARLTRTTTHFGGMLDSLADLVTFGLAPALVAKVMIQDVFVGDPEQFKKLAFLTAAFFVVCAALRLARYNAEQEDTEAAVSDFIGLPTPGAAGVIAGVAICHKGFLAWWEPSLMGQQVAAHVLGFGVVATLALLMVSRVPYAHVANRYLRGQRPVGRVALLLFLVMLVLYLEPRSVLAAVFTIYALSGPMAVLPRLIRGRRASAVPELFD